MANRWQTLSWVIGSPWGTAQDGDLTISSNTTQASDSKTCTGSGTSLTLGSSGFTNGDVIMVWQVTGTNAGQWEFAKVISGGGTTSITVQKTLQYTYTSGAIAHKFPQYGTVTIDSGKTLTATQYNGANGIVGFIARTVVVNGVISASGKGFAGGIVIGTNNSYQGDGYPGAGAGGSSAVRNPNGNGGGAGIDYQNGSGGGGGHGTAGSNATTNSGGYGGNTYGSADLTTLTFGGGGGGATIGGGNPGNGNTGGNGGGLIFIYSQSLSISGSITNSGANGVAGYDTVSGAGAGGAILLKCGTASIGSNLITASAGTASGTGGSGGVGRIHLDYSQSYTGTTSPTLDVARDTSLLGAPRRTMFI